MKLAIAFAAKILALGLAPTISARTLVIHGEIYDSENYFLAEAQSREFAPCDDAASSTELAAAHELAKQIETVQLGSESRRETRELALGDSRPVTDQKFIETITRSASAPPWIPDAVELVELERRGGQCRYRARLAVAKTQFKRREQRAALQRQLIDAIVQASMRSGEMALQAAMRRRKPLPLECPPPYTIWLTAFAPTTYRTVRDNVRGGDLLLAITPSNNTYGVTIEGPGVDPATGEPLEVRVPVRSWRAASADDPQVIAEIRAHIVEGVAKQAAARIKEILLAGQSNNIRFLTISASHRHAGESWVVGLEAILGAEQVAWLFAATEVKGSVDIWTSFFVSPSLERQVADYIAHSGVLDLSAERLDLLADHGSARAETKKGWAE